MIALRPFGTAVLAMLLAACGQPTDERLDVVFPDYSDTGDANASALEEHRMIATQMGLVTFDTAALVRPGVAERWVISDDGLSYIFRLGEYRWADGEAVAARDIAKLLNERLREIRRSPMGSELMPIADVIARTDEILEIQLDAPVPRLLDLLASPELTLALRGEGLGPMKSSKWPGGGHLLTLPTADDDGVQPGDDSSRPIVVLSMTPPKAVAAFEAGMADLLLDMRYGSVPLLQAAEIADDLMLKDPALGHFGIDIARGEGALSTPAVREAIAMSLDRPRILAAFGLADWRVMTTLAPPDLTNRGELAAPFWDQLDMAERKARARVRVAETGLTGEELEIYIPDDGPGSALLFGLLRRDFAEIGLRLRRSVDDDGADMRLVDKVADFDDPLWYLARLGCGGRSLCDEKADALVAAARNQGFPSERMALLVDAEQRLLSLTSFIPIAEPLRISVTRAPLPGLEPNLRALHPLQYLATMPDR